MSASENTVPPLAKYLASNDKKTRDKAIKNLAAFLSESSIDTLSDTEMAKLWKGIFYCFWMSDKPLVQQALASEIAELLLAITTTSASLRFLKGFWEATVREWSGIDRLRIDKYLMLIRRFVNASFRLLLRAEWEREAIDEYNEMLSRKGGPLCPSDIRVPAGLAYHLADIYLEEIDKALFSTTGLPAPLTLLLRPFFDLAAKTNVNVTYRRVQSGVLEPLFSALSEPDREDEPPKSKRIRLDSEEANPYPHLIARSCLENPKTEGSVDTSGLRKGLLRALFDVASQPDIREANRRKLYALWKEGSADSESDDE